MNEVKVITELTQEDRDRLDTIIAIGMELVKLRTAAQPTPTVSKEELLGVVRELADPEEVPNPVSDVARPEERLVHPVDEVIPYNDRARAVSPEELLALVQRLATPSNPKRVRAKEIVKSYAAKVSEVPEDKRVECYDRLTALEQEG